VLLKDTILLHLSITIEQAVLILGVLFSSLTASVLVVTVYLQAKELRNQKRNFENTLQHQEGISKILTRLTNDTAKNSHLESKIIRAQALIALHKATGS